MHRATAELIARGQAQRAKKAGDAAPEYALLDPDGNQSPRANCCRSWIA
jgi:hypothetical protein